MPLLVILTVVIVLAAVAGTIAHWREHRREHSTESIRQALLFYADRSHWTRNHYHGRRWSLPAAVKDRGARARRALEGLPIPRHTHREDS